MNNQSLITNNQNQWHPFDLEERTSKLGEEIIKLVKTLPVNDVTRSLITQIVRSSTSIGANYREANSSESKKDFRHSIFRCKKEAKETCHWLRMLSVATPERKSDMMKVQQEAEELIRIFSAILRK